MKLKDKVQHALQESRMLVLGAQVLLGFELRGFFEPRFEALPASAVAMKLTGLFLMLLVLGLLLAIPARHRLVEEGRDSVELHGFVQRTMDFVLLPFALALGTDLFVAGQRVGGERVAVVAGAAAAATAIGFWYVLVAVVRVRRGPPDSEVEMGETKLEDRVSQLLTEARVVLPGAQALLGFQLAIILTEAFEGLPESSRWIHLASLGLVALTVILLMSPAAYHRIVERGNDTEQFHTFGSRVVVAAMVPLGLGICGDVFVVVRKALHATAPAAVAAGAVALFFASVWFGLTLAIRVRRRGGEAARTAHAR